MGYPELHTNPKVDHRTEEVNKSTSSGHNLFKSGLVLIYYVFLVFFLHSFKILSKVPKYTIREWVTSFRLSTFGTESETDYNTLGCNVCSVEVTLEYLSLQPTGICQKRDLCTILFATFRHKFWLVLKYLVGPFWRHEHITMVTEWKAKK